ncbi:DegT/DnrJ/EryC1/StrS family aminotransferase [Mucilaginibacter daejeonensis]|uniref:DegT/DnrJ/EryC1/StrS family aminotransferase n=1 Tax=Mucilaginibacter daejeonensis TaxID=398049 RepID=UPI001D177F97|nr:DegT/DnrJ/EryC1/StrS family aminotransferase [Mucilaginibacter daejeonensis]UEG53825.1 DegT/DnrJ/EryC1/StrS family aminotransferase [Mucilaginibacter daejeonensis]
MIAYENLHELNKPFVERFKQEFDAFLDSGWYILGKSVSRFEEEYAAWNGSAYCVGLANGLDALTLALKAYDLEPGSEVIVPSNTYIATILSILNNGLVPVLVEPDIRTYNIDPQLIKKAITPRTKAIMVVHLYGKCCEMEAITAISKQHDLILIEDCAQAHGAALNGRKTGTFGHFGAFSFYPTKNLGALGDAGAVTTNNAELAGVMRQLRNYGSSVKYHNERIGTNSRLDELQAAFLSIKLKAIDAINDHKRELAALYLQGLNDHVIKPVVQEGYHDVYHIFNIRHDRRDELKAHLLQKGIGTEIHYPVAPHQQQALSKALIDQEFPISAEIHRTTLSLPCSYWHTPGQVEKVIDAVNAFG